jgi:prepilin-type N-terminal cleavage/methylation domain-containing protein
VSPCPANSLAAYAAFTLLELMAVLVITAILAGAVVLTMSGRLDEARMTDVVARLGDLDRWTRHDARRLRPACLVFDLDRDMAWRDTGERNRILTLPPGYSLAALRDSRGTVRDGEVRIECSSEGRTDSYALAVAGPDHALAWVVFAGLTGQSTQAVNEAEIDTVFASSAVSVTGGP